ncbi:ABC transporter substrate-binding protein [Phaeovulum sp.]|uniref:ABC transporter substrate-binding protein n=1 Tax=Phaeovulum sp. TaxID=2934796 RepID=UPI0039E27BF8
MKRHITTAIAGLATITIGSTVAAQEITVMSFGGAYGASQMEAYYKPYMAETGVKIISVDADNPAIPVKAQVEAGNVTLDVVDLEPSDVVRLCDEGALEVLPIDDLPDGADGTPARDDFVDGTLYDCAVGTIVYSTLIAYRADLTNAVTSSADFFDLENFPGKRGMRKSAKFALELALMADGVAPADVYDTLSTPEGVDRAFAMLDKIKGQVVWWEAGAQAPQLLADGEVVMTTGYNGRFFDAMVEEGQPFTLFWPHQILDFNLYAIPTGAPHKDEAWKFIKYATDTTRLASQATYISYGPARRSSAAMVGLYKDGKTEIAPFLPTYPDYVADSLTTSIDFWADHDIELSERFNTWLVN